MEIFINKNGIRFDRFIFENRWVTDIYIDEKTQTINDDYKLLIYHFDNDYRVFPNYENLTIIDFLQLFNLEYVEKVNEIDIHDIEPQNNEALINFLNVKKIIDHEFPIENNLKKNICKNCNKEFFHAKKDKKFCSDVCYRDSIQKNKKT